VAEPPFTIVVVTWNSAPEIPALVESVHAHLDRPHELLFVDNASTDGTPDLIRQLAPESTVVQMDHNTDFTGGNNIGVREAKHDVVVLLNADTILLDDSLADLAALARETGAICGPRLLYEDGSDQISAWAPVGSWENLLAAIWPTAHMPDALASRCDPWRVDHRAEAGWISAACFAARRDLMIELGPFDEFFPFHGDDIDMAVRARKRGIKCLFAPDVSRIIHIGNKSVEKRWNDRGIKRQVETRVQVAQRNFAAPRVAFDWFAQFLMYGLRSVAKTLIRHPDADRDRAYVSALLGVLRPGSAS
jgi:GT2 family glycosyltransferase